MEIASPCIITPRLMPGLDIADGFVSIEYAGETSDGRQRYAYYIDTPTWEHEGRDLKSGVGGGSLQEGLVSLLAFMGDAGERYRYAMQHDGVHPDGDEDHFPKHVMEWCYVNQSDIDLACAVIEEEPDLIQE